MPSLMGIGGAGIAHFSHRMILSAFNLNQQAFPNAAMTVLRFASLDNTGDLSRFSSCYSTATGTFTVPAGGLKNVQIMCQLGVGSITNGELYVQINNTIRAVTKCKGFDTVVFNAPLLEAGDQIRIILFNIASGPQQAGNSQLEYFHIFASN
jgi:hypothetical protein